MNLPKCLLTIAVKSRSVGIFLMVLCLMCTHLQAKDVLLEAKASYFGFTDSYFRKIYGSGAGLYGMEVSARAWKNLFPWTSISFLYKEGYVEKFPYPKDPLFAFLEPVNLLFVPLGVGLKYLFPVRMIDFYVGAGALVTFVHTSHDFWTMRQIGGGGIAKLGILFYHRKNLFLDLFGDYSWQFIPNSFLGKRKVFTANLSGWSAGVGLGYKF